MRERIEILPARIRKEVASASKCKLEVRAKLTEQWTTTPL